MDDPRVVAVCAGDTDLQEGPGVRGAEVHGDVLAGDGEDREGVPYRVQHVRVLVTALAGAVPDLHPVRVA